jgi:hypothetical protein
MRNLRSLLRLLNTLSACRSVFYKLLHHWLSPYLAITPALNVEGKANVFLGLYVPATPREKFGKAK